MRSEYPTLFALCIVSSVDAQFCCMAFTPQCNACNAGVTVEVYCANNPTFPGCDAYITVQSPPPPPPLSQLPPPPRPVAQSPPPPPRPMSSPPPSPPPLPSLSPPVALSPPMAASPSAMTVETSFTLSGDVSNYGFYEINAIKALIAAEVGVQQSAVTVAITAASVHVTATIAVTSTTQAGTVHSTLSTGIMASPAALQAAMQTTSSPVLRTAIVEAAPTVCPPGGCNSTAAALNVKEALGMPSVWIIVGCAVGAAVLLLIAFAAYRCRKPRKDTRANVNHSELSKQLGSF